MKQPLVVRAELVEGYDAALRQAQGERSTMLFDYLLNLHQLMAIDERFSNLALSR
jgi:hypothetical protein